MVEELFPALVAVRRQVNPDNRVAFRFFRLLDQCHMSLFWRAAAFLDIAPCAGAHNIRPGAFAAEHPGNDMVQRQFGRGKFLAAVLTAAAVTGKNIAAVEFDRLTGQPVIKKETNDARYSDVEMNGGNPVMLVSLKAAFGFAGLLPHMKIIVGKSSVITGNYFGLLPAQQRKRTLGTNHTESPIVLV